MLILVFRYANSDMRKNLFRTRFTTRLLAEYYAGRAYQIKKIS